MQYIYQLCAEGYSGVFNSSLKLISSTVFISEEEAEKRIEKFKEMCCDKKSFNYITTDSVQVTVKKLEIVE